METITALSVLDGRYKRLTTELRDTFSEYGLIKYRVKVEVEWLKFLVRELKLADIPETDIKKIDSIYENLDAEAALKVKAIERTTNHDVKAVEYYIKDCLEEAGLSSIKEWVHFACTSDDINNTAYALMIKEGIAIALVNAKEVLAKIEELAKKYKAEPMMSRTHGQPATPTTTGKELVNFAWRIKKEIENLEKVDVFCLCLGEKRS